MSDQEAPVICCCGDTIHSVEVPPDIRRRDPGIPTHLWVHEENRDTRCYPEVRGDRCVAQPYT